jgi:hypothetical protein
MDVDFAGLVEKVNNFSMDGIFASNSRFRVAVNLGEIVLPKFNRLPNSR